MSYGGGYGGGGGGYGGGSRGGYDYNPSSRNSYQDRPSYNGYDTYVWKILCEAKLAFALIYVATDVLDIEAFAALCMFAQLWSLCLVQH